MNSEQEAECPQAIHGASDSGVIRAAHVPISEQAADYSMRMLMDEVVASSIVSELEDILGVTACDCGDVVSAVRTLKVENERLRGRLREYEAELTRLRPLAEKTSEIRR